MDIPLALALMVLLLLLKGFFSGSEIALVNSDKFKLRHNAKHGHRGSELVLKLFQTPEVLLSTTLVGTNISVVTNTTVVTALVIQLFGEQYSWLAIIIAAPLIWIFGEIVAKSIFSNGPTPSRPRRSSCFAPPLMCSSRSWSCSPP